MSYLLKPCCDQCDVLASATDKQRTQNACLNLQVSAHADLGPLIDKLSSSEILRSFDYVDFV